MRDYSKEIDLSSVSRPVSQWTIIGQRSPTDIFYNYSNIAINMCNIIDEELNLSTINNNITHIKFINLSSQKRHIVYRELSNLNIRFVKVPAPNNINNPQHPNIVIDISAIWSINNYRIIPFPYHVAHYQPFIDFNTHIMNQYPQTNLPLIVVTMDDYLKHIRLLTNIQYIPYQTTQTTYSAFQIRPPVTIPPPLPTQNTYSAFQIRPPVTTPPPLPITMVIKLEIADLIFDIKEKITDCEYKDILEKLATIKS
jgi:hypothetical protein